MRSFFVILSLAGSLCAPDAGMALSQSVSTRTLRNTSKLPAAQLAEVDALTSAAAKAGAQQKFSESVKDYQHAMAILRGDVWTPERAWTSALTMKPDHSVVEPGQV